MLQNSIEHYFQVVDQVTEVTQQKQRKGGRRRNPSLMACVQGLRLTVLDCIWMASGDLEFSCHGQAHIPPL